MHVRALLGNATPFNSAHSRLQPVDRIFTQTSMASHGKDRSKRIGLIVVGRHSHNRIVDQLRCHNIPVA